MHPWGILAAFGGGAVVGGLIGHILHELLDIYRMAPRRRR